jgi:hypothetical protein
LTLLLSRNGQRVHRGFDLQHDFFGFFPLTPITVRPQGYLPSEERRFIPIADD